MDLKDLLKSWDVAAQQAMENAPGSKPPSDGPNIPSWLRLRTGILTGGQIVDDDCDFWGNDGCI